MSKADTIHHDQIRFLRQLAERLETTRDVNITLADLRHRIRTLEHGPLATTEPLALVFHTEQLTPDTAKSASPGLEPSPQTDYTVSASTERPADAGEIATTQQSRKPSDNGNLQDNANTHRESGPKIDTIEFLAWGRHTGKCFPHRTCDCRSIRPYAEIVSINADLGWAGIRRTPYELPQTALLAQSEARWLVQFHLNYILWHHNVFHARTFLMQCEEFWTAGTVHHPLWAALYLSVLAVGDAPCFEYQVSYLTTIDEYRYPHGQYSIPPGSRQIYMSVRALLPTFFEQWFRHSMMETFSRTRHVSTHLICPDCRETA
jgi:hypothetical protein